MEKFFRSQNKFEIVPPERGRGSVPMSCRRVDSSSEFGIITSASSPLGADCDGLRIRADGQVAPCLFSNNRYDLTALIRRKGSDKDISRFLKESVRLISQGVKALIGRNVPLHHVYPMYVTGG